MKPKKKNLIRGWRCSSVVKRLTSMRKVLGSIPSTTKTKKKKQGKKRKKLKIK
jgi:hypothetical protein